MALDDQNPAFVYSGDWHGAGSDAEFLQTTTWTNSTGSTATISFTGTSVSVWGTIAPLGLGTAPQSSYNIDNGPATLFVGTQQSSTQYKQCFFQSAQLPFANHTLRIQTLVSGAYYYIDYVTVVPTDSNEKLLLPTPSTSTTKSTSRPTSTAAVSTNTSSTASFPAGAIVGGVLGALALIMLGVIAVMWLRRRRNDSRSHRKNRPTEVTTSLWIRRPNSTCSSDITPFITRSYPPLRNHNYTEEVLVDYTSAIHNRTQLQDLFDTYRSTASSSTARYNQSDPFSTPLLESRDRLPASKISERPVQDHINLPVASSSGSSSRSQVHPPPPDVPPPDYH